MPSCSQPSRTLRAAEAVARSRAILDRRCARRHIARAGRDGRMVPIEQKDWTEEDRASKLGQNHPLDSTKRLYFNAFEKAAGLVGARAHQAARTFGVVAGMARLSRRSGRAGSWAACQSSRSGLAGWYADV